MAKITDYELGDLVESVGWFTRNYDSNKAYENDDIAGPMSPAQTMRSLEKLVREYDKVYKQAFLVIPIPKFIRRFFRARS